MHKQPIETSPRQNEHAQRLDAIINTVVDGIITIDEQGTIETVNPATEKIFGYTADDMVGRNVSMLMPAPYQREHDGYLEHYRDTGERKIIGSGREVKGLRKDGTVFPLELAVSETFVGERRFFTGIVRDITKRRLAETALDESDNSNRAIVEAIPDAMMRYRYDGTLLQYKPPTSYTPITPLDDLIGQKLHEHLDAEMANLVLTQIQHAISIQEPWTFVYETLVDGEKRTREARTVPVSEYEVIMVVRDITERAKAKELLEQRVQKRTEQLERRRQVSDNLRATLHVLNTYHSSDELFSHIATQSASLFEAEATLIYEFQLESNDCRLEHFYGVEAAEVVARLRLKDESIVCRAIQQRELLATPGLEGYQAGHGDELSAMLIKSGFASALTVPIYIREHIFGALVLCFRDEQKFSDEEQDLAVTFGYQVALAIENAEFRRQLEEAAIGEERNRIARDLHDSVTQTLFSTSMIADVLPLIWERDPDAGLSRLLELRELARGALAEMRTLLLELRSTAIVEAELDQLLRQLADATIGRARIPVEVQVTDNVNILPAEWRVAIYRIVQEALNNASKHSEASRILVSLDADRIAGVDGDPPDRFQLLVSDNGRGFSPADRKGGHFGLSNMQERAEMIGATFSIESPPDQGTVIKVQN